jgi:hypothetical protein
LKLERSASNSARISSFAMSRLYEAFFADQAPIVSCFDRVVYFGPDLRSALAADPRLEAASQALLSLGHEATECKYSPYRHGLLGAFAKDLSRLSLSD